MTWFNLNCCFPSSRKKNEYPKCVINEKLKTRCIFCKKTKPRIGKCECEISKPSCEEMYKLL